MAEVKPLRALHYNLGAIPSLAPVTAPPYDVIDARQRAELLSRSPFNIVEIDLPNPRTAQTREEPRYFELVTRVREALHLGSDLDAVAQ